MAEVRDITIPFTPRPLQADMAETLDTHRFGVAVCHRRFGKTVLAVNQLLKEAVLSGKERPRFAYLGPTYRQAKANAWDYLLHYSEPFGSHDLPQGFRRQVNVSELRVDFPHNGSQIRVYGADNPDSLRGIYLDGVVLDEYGLMPPNVWGEVLRPALSDRVGWALFIGTPAGRNQFYHLIHGDGRDWPGAKNVGGDWFFSEYKASKTGYVTADELANARKTMTADEYEQEYECSFEAAVKGAIYARELADARAANRVTSIPIDPALPVDTDWDLGIGDAMAIWFSQSLRSGEVRLIDYHESSGEGFPAYAEVLKRKGYRYGKHYAPHDISVRELNGRSRLEVAASYGIRFMLTPRVAVGTGDEVEEGIHAARMLFPLCWFDAARCAAGIEALGNYRRDYNSRLRELKATPVHDWASHGADAFRGLAVRHQIPKLEREKRRVQMPREFSWS